MLRVVKDTLRKPYQSIRNFFWPMPSQLSNFECNRALWNEYARKWRKEIVYVENTGVTEKQRESYLHYLGDEWGRVADVEKIVEEYIVPFIPKEGVVAEIGSGGGRVASKIAPRAKELYCFDIASKMLKRARVALRNYPNARFVLLQEPKFPSEFAEMFDFVYSFDVFVHFDLYMMWKYLNEIRRIIKPGGKVFIHTTNLQAEEGWKWFSSQDNYSVGGGYFVSPEIVEILVRRSKFKVVKRSTLDGTNFYLARDYLVVLEP